MSENTNQKVAVIQDGEAGNEVILFFGQHEIDWPEDWPDTISTEFLQQQGYDIRWVD